MGGRRFCFVISVGEGMGKGKRATWLVLGRLKIEKTRIARAASHTTDTEPGRRWQDRTGHRHTARTGQDLLSCSRSCWDHECNRSARGKVCTAAARKGQRVPRRVSSARRVPSAFSVVCRWWLAVAIQCCCRWAATACSVGRAKGRGSITFFFPMFSFPVLIGRPEPKTLAIGSSWKHGQKGYREPTT